MTSTFNNNDASSTNPIKDLIYCPITRRIMVDPVVTALGDTFEREAIEEWLSRRETNPTTGEALPNRNLSFNKTVKQMIDVFLETNPSYALNMDERYVTNKMTEKLRDLFDGEADEKDSSSSSSSQLTYTLTSQAYLQLYTEFKCIPIMAKGTASYLDDGNILHVLCECPNANSKTLQTLLESLEKLQQKSATISTPNLSTLVRDTIFGKNSRGLQPIHTACFFNESEQLFKALIKLQETYQTQFDKSSITIQHPELDPRCKKNLYLLMFKLIITTSPTRNSSMYRNDSEDELNDKCLDFIFDKMSLSGEQLARITHQGVSLVNYACKYNRLHLVKKMIEKSGLNVEHHVDTFYHTPLTSAVLGGAFGVVKYLIDDLKVDVEARQAEVPNIRRDFPSALHLAVLRGHFEIAEFLVSRGADLNSTCKMSTANGSSCLDVSETCVNKALFGSRYYNGESPSTSTSCAFKQEDKEEVHNILTLCLLLCSDKHEMTKKAIDFLTNLVENHHYKPTFPSTGNSSTVIGTEPLWFSIRSIASKSECENLYEWILMQFYSDRQKLLSLKDRTKNNGLHWLAAYGKVEMLEMTILHLSNDPTIDVHVMINQKNQNGDTPLHVASQLGRKDICKMLIDLGADVRIRNIKLQDALSAGFVGSAVSTLTAQYRMNFLKDLRKCLEYRESGKTILSMQAKIRMLEKKLLENQISSPNLSCLNVDP